MNNSKSNNTAATPANRFRASYLGPHRPKPQQAGAGPSTEKGKGMGGRLMQQQKVQSHLPVKEVPMGNDLVHEVWSSETPPETGRTQGTHQGPRKATFDIASPQDLGSPDSHRDVEDQYAAQATPYAKKSEISDEQLQVFSNVTFCQNQSLARSSHAKQYGDLNFTTDGSNFPTHRSKERKVQVPTYSFGRYSSQESQGQAMKQQQLNSSEYADPYHKSSFAFATLNEGIVGSSIFKSIPQPLKVPGPVPPGPPPGLTAPSPSASAPPKPQPQPQSIQIGKQSVVLSYGREADTSSVKSAKAQSFVGKAAGRIQQKSMRESSKMSADDKIMKQIQTKNSHNVQNRVQSAIQERRTEVISNFQSSQRSLFKQKPAQQSTIKLNQDLPLNVKATASNARPSGKPSVPLGLKLDQLVAGGGLPSATHNLSEQSDSTLPRKTSADPRFPPDEPSNSLQALGPPGVSIQEQADQAREGLRSAPGAGEAAKSPSENVYEDSLRSGRTKRPHMKERPQTEKDMRRRHGDDGIYSNNLEDAGANASRNPQQLISLNINKIQENALCESRLEKMDGELDSHTVVTACKPSARATQQSNLMKTGASYLKKEDSIDQLKIFVGNMSKRTFGQSERNQGNQIETTSPPREELSFSPAERERLDDLPASEHRQLDRKYKSGGEKSSRRVPDSGNMTADFGGEPSFNLASSRALSSRKGVGPQGLLNQSGDSPYRHKTSTIINQLSNARVQKPQQQPRIESLMQTVSRSIQQEDRRNQSQQYKSPLRHSNLTQSPKQQQKLAGSPPANKKSSPSKDTPNSQTKFDEHGEKMKQNYFNHQKTTGALTRKHVNYSDLDEQLIKNSPKKRDGLSLPLGSFVNSVFNGENASAVHLNVKFSSLREQLQQIDSSKQKVANEMKALQQSHNQFKSNFIQKENAKDVKKQLDSKRLLNKKMSANHVTYQNQASKSQPKMSEPGKAHNSVKHSKKLSLMNQKYLSSVQNQRQNGKVNSVKSGRGHVGGISGQSYQQQSHSQHQSIHLQDSSKPGKEVQQSNQKRIVFMHQTTDTTAQASADISKHILASSKSSADISKLDQFQHYPRHVHVYGGGGSSHMELNNLSTNAKETEGSKDGRDDKSRKSTSFNLNLNQSTQALPQQVFTTMVQAPKLKQDLQGHPQKLGISAVASLEDLSVHHPSMSNIFKYDEYKGGEDEQNAPKNDGANLSSDTKQQPKLPSFHHLDSNFNNSPQRLALPLPLPLPLSKIDNNFESYKDMGEMKSDKKQLNGTDVKNAASSKFDSTSFNVDQQSQAQHMSRFSHFQLQEYDGHASTIIKKSDSNMSRGSSLNKQFDQSGSANPGGSLHFQNDTTNSKYDNQSSKATIEKHLQSSSHQFKFIKQTPILKPTITQSYQNMALGFPSQSSLETLEKSVDNNNHMFTSINQYNSINVTEDVANKNLKYIKKNFSPGSNQQNSKILNRNSLSPKQNSNLNKRFVQFADQFNDLRKNKRAQMQTHIQKKNHQTISKSITPILSSNGGVTNAGTGHGPTTERIKGELQTMQQHIRLLQWQAQEYNSVKMDPSCYNSFNGPRALRPELQVGFDNGKLSARSALDERPQIGKIIKDDDILEQEAEYKVVDDMRPSYFENHSVGAVRGREARRASGQPKSTDDGPRSRSRSRSNEPVQDNKLKQIAKKHNININDVFRQNTKRMSLVGHQFRANSTRSALKGRKLTRTPISVDNGSQAIQYQSQRLKQRKTNKISHGFKSQKNLVKLNNYQMPTKSSEKASGGPALRDAKISVQLNDKFNQMSVENAKQLSSGQVSQRNKSQKSIRIVSTQIKKNDKAKRQQNHEQIPSVQQSQQSINVQTLQTINASSMQNPLLSQASNPCLPMHSQQHMSMSSHDDSIINILEVERMEKEYRRMLDQNLTMMRQNHQSQIQDLMRMIHEKDAQIQNMEKTHMKEMYEAKKQQSSRNRIDEVYNMIGKVQDNMLTIEDMNKRALADRVVQTIISSSGSSPSMAIVSQRTKNQQQFSDRSLINGHTFLQQEESATIGKEHPKSRQPANISLVKQSHTLQDANRQSMLIERPSLLDRKKGPSLVQECIENQHESSSPENSEFRPSFPSKDPSQTNTQRMKQSER